MAEWIFGIAAAALYIGAYLALIIAAYLVVSAITGALAQAGGRSKDFTSLKTVTFGDESAVRASRAASIISILAIFLLWGAFTGSAYAPIHAPGPFKGETEFTYTVATPDGRSDDAEVTFIVFPVGQDVELPEVDPGDGFAKNDIGKVGAWRSTLLRVDRNDELGRAEGASVVAIDGQPIAPGETVR
ncbi:MAG: ABC transporter permease, partial [Pseudomonadota bacterium]